MGKVYNLVFDYWHSIFTFCSLGGPFRLIVKRNTKMTRTKRTLRTTTNKKFGQLNHHKPLFVIILMIIIICCLILSSFDRNS